MQQHNRSESMLELRNGMRKGCSEYSEWNPKQSYRLIMRGPESGLWLDACLLCRVLPNGLWKDLVEIRLDACHSNGEGEAVNPSTTAWCRRRCRPTARIIKSRGIIIYCCPEYHKSYTALAISNLLLFTKAKPCPTQTSHAPCKLAFCATI